MGGCCLVIEYAAGPGPRPMTASAESGADGIAESQHEVLVCAVASDSGAARLCFPRPREFRTRLAPSGATADCPKFVRSSGVTVPRVRELCASPVFPRGPHPGGRQA